LTGFAGGVYMVLKIHYKLILFAIHRPGDIGMSEQKEIEEKTREICSRLGNKRENLIPILQQIQEALGYLPSHAMVEVARFLDIPEIDVYSVVTFYNQFRLTPPGKHSIRVCMGTACHVKGGHITLEAWQRRLKIGPGETTPDREFDLDTVACVGCCAMAPVTVVDKKVEAKADPTRVDGILLSYQLQKEKEGKETN
jgi:NADH-quinone oxidoreductase subunit E